MIGVILRKAQKRIQKPARLRRLIDQIDCENWSGLEVMISQVSQ
jgi:type I restriction enzyme M protein